jgi:ketosteroid isomerase-like protein
MEKEILLQFIAAINKHDLNALSNLMADEHLFIDAHNNEVKGRDKMLAGWKFYFDWFPDYTIDVENILNNESGFALFGFAEGTYHNLKAEGDKAHWRLPAAWKATVHNNKVSLWQVYADTMIPFEIINRYALPAAKTIK